MDTMYSAASIEYHDTDISPSHSILTTSQPVNPTLKNIIHKHTRKKKDKKLQKRKEIYKQTNKQTNKNSIVL